MQKMLIFSSWVGQSQTARLVRSEGPTEGSLVLCLSDAQCLVARTGHLWEVARERAGQRRATMAQEEGSRKEEESDFASYVRGRGDGLASEHQFKIFFSKITIGKNEQ